jgi:hypothetical protein
MIENDEIGRIYKEEVMAYLGSIIYLCDGTEEDREERIAGLSFKILDSLNMNQVC